MNIAAFCIKHKVTTILAFILLSIFGIVFYTNLKLTLMPNIEYPAAFVSCYYSGAGPEDMEELVTRPLESVIATLPGVKEINSTSSENSTSVTISYEDGTDVDVAATKLREKFDALSLPDGCQKPIIHNFSMDEMMPVVATVLMGDNLSELQTLAEKTVGPALERIEGVASVEISGGLDTQVVVDVNSARVTGYNLSISYLTNYLSSANGLYPGGDVKNGSQKLTVSTDGQFQSVSDVANTLIPLPAGGTVRLSELADVYLEEDHQESIAKADGQSCVVLAVHKQSNANEVETADDIRQALEHLKATDDSLEYLIVFDTSDYINRTADSAIQNIILGVILSAFVVFLFLRRFGATLTIALSMPFCIVMVFLIMNVFDITMNMMSLGGIAMGVGMIVDNSIVVLENIYRYAREGYSRYESCVLGTKEVTLPVAASTLTTMAVFLPIGLSGGIAGMMFKDFCLTIAFLILASLIIALTLVPLLCYFLLDERKLRKRPITARQSFFGNIIARMEQTYLRVLRFLIHKRFFAMLVSIALVAVFTIPCFSSNMILMPEMDQGQVMMTLSTPVGSDLEQTASLADHAVALVQKECPELVSLYYSATAQTATIVLNLVSAEERTQSSMEIANNLRDKLQDIAGCKISASSYSMSSTSNASDIDIKISGDDYDVLSKIAGDLKTQIAALEDAVDVKTSVEEAAPAVSIDIRRENAAQYGLTAAAIGTAVRSELTGATATSLTLSGNDIDVVVRGENAASSLDALRSTPISTPAGGHIPLSLVADVSVVLTPQSITRIDQSRQVSITGDTISGNTTEITNQINAILDNYQMPEHYTAEAGGAYTEMMDTFHDLILALVVAIGLVYFILASQFESFIMPVIVMMILPIAFSGALFGLPITHNDLSIVAIVGLIMLAGVVVNASIILVDYINVRRAAGETKEDAILLACPLRIRPIMMTTLTTVLALIPMSLGMGDGAEMMQPLGIVMMSGMIISTAITLFFTPVYYSILDSFSTRLRRLLRRNRKAANSLDDEL